MYSASTSPSPKEAVPPTTAAPVTSRALEAAAAEGLLLLPPRPWRREADAAADTDDVDFVLLPRRVTDFTLRPLPEAPPPPLTPPGNR